MSGTGHTTTNVTATGNAYIDGLLARTRWADAVLTYSFPTSRGEYADQSDTGSFRSLPASHQTTVRFALDSDDGITANNGFSVEGFTNLTVQQTGAQKAHIRLAYNAPNSTAYAYLPDSTDWAGDVWFGPSARSTPVAGNYTWITTLHEIGHALGLEHPHEGGVAGVVPADRDAMEYTLMSYRSYVGGTTSGGYTNATFGYAQTFMMLDIAALQTLYGADYTTNSGNTTYFWTPNSGATYVDGAVAISPGANTIFATIWDGGGIDTFHLASYKTAVYVDLRPGNSSLFSGSQLASLGDGRFASGNIYNALLFNGDTRSLIENVYGGSGADALIGNQANNVIAGFGGNDRIWALEGDDIITGGAGADYIHGTDGFDYAGYWGATSTVVIVLDYAVAGGSVSSGSGYYGEAQGDILEDIEGLIGSAFTDYLLGNGVANVIQGGGGRDALYGRAGNDTIDGQADGDWIWGDEGNDSLTGGGGADEFIFNTTLNAATNVDTITDFVAGVEKMWLDDAVFAGVGAIGALSASAFLSSASGAATSAAQRILYNSATGDLSFDADGDGAGSAVRFASVTAGLGLSAADFLIF